MWCWEKEVLEVTVERTNRPSTLNFVQVGFRLEIAVPINITLVRSVFIHLFQIWNIVCTVYTCIHVVKCMRFCEQIYSAIKKYSLSLVVKIRMYSIAPNFIVDSFVIFVNYRDHKNFVPENILIVVYC